MQTNEEAREAIGPDDLQARIEEARERVRELDREVRRICLEHPLLVLAGAALVGFVVGRIASRR